jgi:fluoride exporter
MPSNDAANPGCTARHRKVATVRTSTDRGEFERVIDPDVDLHDAAQRDETRGGEWSVVLACSAGGVLGAWARYGIGLMWRNHAGEFGWSTVLVNVTGSLLLGALMVVLLEIGTPHRLARPFLGVGVLGGFTTFSAFAVDAAALVHSHRTGVAAAYVLATILGCCAAVWMSTALVRRLVNGRG